MIKKRTSIKIVAIIFFLVLIIFGGIFMKGYVVTASRPSSNYKYYTQIRVDRGETLWGIAQTYMSDEYDSVDDYIQEVKELNSLYNSEISYGDYLMVPYFSDEWK